MSKLNQVIAVEKGIKQKNNDVGSELYKALDKPGLFNGLTKKYKPLDEEGEKLQDQSVKVQMSVDQVLKENARVLIDLLDITATKDLANCEAKASVVVDGVTLFEKVPATYLLFLEKQLSDLHAFVLRLPVLDPAKDWTFDANALLFKTEPVQTLRTKKIEKALVLYDATDKHPAQVKTVTDDQTVGTWETVELSGAIPLPKKNALIEKVQKAVKFAREEANTTEVVTAKVGDKMLSWLLG
jgi:hypothetical protein